MITRTRRGTILTYHEVDGRGFPPLVVSQDTTMTGTNQIDVHVRAGEFVLAGELYGCLAIDDGATARIHGVQMGAVNVASHATVYVDGSIKGSVSVAPNASLVIEESGSHSGSLLNNGIVVLRGVIDGPRSGDGVLRIEGAGYIQQPIGGAGVSRD